MASYFLFRSSGFLLVSYGCGCLFMASNKLLLMASKLSIHFDSLFVWFGNRRFQSHQSHCFDRILICKKKKFFWTPKFGFVIFISLVSHFWLHVWPACQTCTSIFSTKRNKRLQLGSSKSGNSNTQLKRWIAKCLDNFIVSVCTACKMIQLGYHLAYHFVGIIGGIIWRYHSDTITWKSFGSPGSATGFQLLLSQRSVVRIWRLTATYPSVS